MSSISTKLQEVCIINPSYKRNNLTIDFQIGVEGLASKLKSNLETGLSSNDLDKRVEHFGTNKKDPPIRTPYCKFFCQAFDDFMLKLLLVCACINIGFEVGFAEDAKHRKVGKYLPSIFMSLLTLQCVHPFTPPFFFFNK